MNRPLLIAFIGTVGSGKTTIARMLAKRLKARHIRTDDIRWRLERQGKPISRAIKIANKLREEHLAQGKSVILDFDAVNPKRHRELKRLARESGAKLFFIHVKAPEKLIVKRLRAQRYPKPGLQSLNQALLAYFSRKRFHKKKSRVRPLFLIDNSKPLAPQIEQIVKKLETG